MKPFLAITGIVCGCLVFATGSPAYLMPQALAAVGLVALIVIDIRRRIARDLAKK